VLKNEQSIYPYSMYCTAQHAENFTCHCEKTISVLETVASCYIQQVTEVLKLPPHSKNFSYSSTSATIMLFGIYIRFYIVKLFLYFAAY